MCRLWRDRDICREREKLHVHWCESELGVFRKTIANKSSPQRQINGNIMQIDVILKYIDRQTQTHTRIKMWLNCVFHQKLFYISTHFVYNWIVRLSPTISQTDALELRTRLCGGNIISKNKKKLQTKWIGSDQMNWPLLKFGIVLDGWVYVSLYACIRRSFWSINGNCMNGRRR